MHDLGGIKPCITDLCWTILEEGTHKYESSFNNPLKISVCPKLDMSEVKPTNWNIIETWNIKIKNL